MMDKVINITDQQAISCGGDISQLFFCCISPDLKAVVKSHESICVAEEVYEEYKYGFKG